MVDVSRWCRRQQCSVRGCWGESQWGGCWRCGVRRRKERNEGSSHHRPRTSRATRYSAAVSATPQGEEPERRVITPASGLVCFAVALFVVGDFGGGGVVLTKHQIERAWGCLCACVRVSVCTALAELWFFANNFRSALFTWGKRCGYLQTNHTKPPPAGFGGSMRQSRAIKKKHHFVYLFSRAAKTSKVALFSLIPKVCGHVGEI
jgi:hypothetical protein